MQQGGASEEREGRTLVRPTARCVDTRAAPCDMEWCRPRTRCSVRLVKPVTSCLSVCQTPDLSSGALVVPHHSDLVAAALGAA
jgi:hypothetical protein